jgi:hypothetical protein
MDTRFFESREYRIHVSSRSAVNTDTVTLGEMELNLSTHLHRYHDNRVRSTRNYMCWHGNTISY